MSIKIILLLFFISWQNVYSQVGGARSFEFIQIPTDALNAALGGQNVSLYGQDVNLFMANPALGSEDITGYLSLNYLFFPGDVDLTGFSYSHHFEKTGILNFGLRYLSYGEIPAFDASGSSLGNYKANEYMLMAGHSRKVHNFGFGISLKFIDSNIAGFGASSLMFDIGGVFVHPEQDFTAGLVIKNLGFVIKDYTETSDSSIPIDVQLGTTFKPQYMPVRFSATIHSLYKRDLAFIQPDEQGGVTDEPGKADKIFRHLVFGAEFLVSKNLNLRMGYNHQRRKELRLEQTSGGAGLSYGVLFKIKAFEFAYTRTNYHVGSAANNFTLTSNLNSIIFKKGTSTL